MTDEQKKKYEEQYRQIRAKVREQGRSSLTLKEREIFDSKRKIFDSRDQTT